MTQIEVPPAGCLVVGDGTVVSTFGSVTAEMLAIMDRAAEHGESERRDALVAEQRELLTAIDSVLAGGPSIAGVSFDLATWGLGTRAISVQALQSVTWPEPAPSDSEQKPMVQVTFGPASPSPAIAVGRILDLLPAIAFLVDADDCLVYLNRNAAGWFGSSMEALAGQDPTKLFVGGDARRDILLSGNDEARKNGYVLVEISAAQLGVAMMRVHKSALVIDGRDLVAGYGVDSSEASIARSRTSAREMQLGRLVDLIPAPIWVLNEHRRIVRLNEAARSLSTVTGSALVGASVDSAYPNSAPVVFGPTDAELVDLATVGGPSPIFESSDGIRVFRVDRTLLPGVGDDSPALAVMLTELTESIGAQQELQLKNEVLEGRNTELDQFAHMASHDMRAPLRAIYAFTQMALEEDGDEHRDHLGAILGAVDRMRMVLDSLLDYATADANPVFRDASLNDIVSSVLGDLASDITETQAAIKVGDLPALHCDPTSMRRLFQNLIANALVHCGDSNPTITITSSVEYRFVEIIVTDRGVGFPQESESEVFRPFKRLSADSTGQGIGLSMCRRIVESHHGTIRAISKVGGPTSFVIRLPRRRTR